MSEPSEITYRDRLINDFAIRSFRDSADGDYIAARLAYRHQLFAQFLWLGHQAIEKYLKCILLQNRIPATDILHDLMVALQRLESHERFPVRVTPESREFIQYLDDQGHTRYLVGSYYLIRHEILRLDHAVWEVRRFAEAHDFYIRGPGGLICLLDEGKRKIQRSDNAPRADFPGVDGLLEKILSNPNHPARAALVWQNPCYGRKRKTVRLQGHLHAVNAPLWLHPEIVDDVRKFVHLPKAAVTAYKELARERVLEQAGELTRPEDGIGRSGNAGAEEQHDESGGRGGS